MAFHWQVDRPAEGWMAKMTWPDIWSPRMPYIKNYIASVAPAKLNIREQKWNLLPKKPIFILSCQKRKCYSQGKNFIVKFVYRTLSDKHPGHFFEMIKTWALNREWKFIKIQISSSPHSFIKVLLRYVKKDSSILILSSMLKLLLSRCFIHSC